MGPEPGPAGSRPSTRCPRDGRWAELFTQVLICLLTLGRPGPSAASLPETDLEEACHPLRFTREASLSSFGQDASCYFTSGRGSF